MSEQSMTYEMIARLFRYDPETGMLHWCSRPEEDFPDERCQKAWNTKFHGKLAGYVNNQNNRRIVRIAVDGKGHNFLSYRIVWMLHKREWPKHTIDHIDGDQSNDRIENLRDVEFKENCKNLAVPSHCKTGIPGVNWDSAKGKWQARVRDHYREVWLGYFDVFDHAVIARKAAERALGYHKNHGRPAKRAPADLFQGNAA